MLQADQWMRQLFGSLALMLAALVVRFALSVQERNRPTAVCATFLVLLGGGLAWVAATWNLATDTIFMRVLEHHPVTFRDALATWPDQWQLAEGCYGEWGASPVRILPSVPECIYHIFFFCGALCVLNGRATLAVLFATLTWWSHPFTGFLFGSILTAFLAVRLLQSHWKALTPFMLMIVTHVGFIAYYLVFLPSYPEHRSVARQLATFGASMLYSKLLPAYGLLLFAPVIYIAQHRRSTMENPNDLFMGVWLVCNLPLVFSDHFVRAAVQPMHFTRGYVYVPLAYFSAKLLTTWVKGAGNLKWRQIVACSVFALHLPDTLCYFARLEMNTRLYTFPLTAARRTVDVLGTLDNAIPDPITIHVLPSANLPGGEALLPVLTHHRALVAHPFNTPDYREKSDYAHKLDTGMAKDFRSRYGLDAVLVGQRDLMRPGLGDPRSSDAIALSDGCWLLRVPK
jgi:hypothetical protein